MPRKVHQYHFIYKTTNLINDKFYIGMHSTSNLEDEYLGFGKILRRSIRKYGKENFRKEIIEYCKDRKELCLREKELVGLIEINDPMCMNISHGGFGGFQNETHQKSFQKAGGIATNKIRSQRMVEKLKLDPDFKRNWILKLSKSITGKSLPPISQSHKDAIGEANSIHQKGEGNSQFGTCWITNGIESKKIKKNDPIPENWKKGRKEIARTERSAPGS